MMTTALQSAKSRYCKHYAVDLTLNFYPDAKLRYVIAFEGFLSGEEI